MADYALANAWQQARQRLALLESELDPATRRRVLAAGIGAGAHCLEVGAGGGSIAHWLCHVVGPTGRVVATDIDPRLVALDAPPGLEVLQHDLTRDPLPAAQFDLVHVRWLLHHLPDLDPVIDRLVAALKPGGLLLVEEPDFYPVHAGHSGSPPLYAQFMDALTRSVVSATGRDCYWARGLPALLAGHGLQNLQAAAEVAVLRGGEALARFYQLSGQQARQRVLDTGLISTADYDAALGLLGDAKLWAFGACTVATWGRRSI